MTDEGGITPLTPDMDLSGIEPPWDLFVTMTAEAFPHVPKAEIQALCDEHRREYWASIAAGGNGRQDD